MRLNRPTPHLYTHEGGTAGYQRPEVELERAISTCMLWENTFYEKGSDIALRIAELCKQVPDDTIAALAIKARGVLHLRHVPLWLVVQLCRKRSKLVAELIPQVVQRADEMAELLSLYWKDGRIPLSAQLKRGLAKVFTNFTPYQLAKWDRQQAIKLRDVMFMCHPKPNDKAQADVWAKLVKGELESPDTWEVKMAAIGQRHDLTPEDKHVLKHEMWDCLLAEKKLGAMAILMNLRNMQEAGVGAEQVNSELMRLAPLSRLLPYRYMAAFKAVPGWATLIERAMLASYTPPQFNEPTCILIDVSGSMDKPISEKSTLSRWEAATALTVHLVGQNDVHVYTFSRYLREVPSLRTLALLTYVNNSQPHGNTDLHGALSQLKRLTYGANAKRIVIITDEQSESGILSAWTPYAYLINVAGYKPGLDVSQGWTRFSGWSEHIVDWIVEEEKHGTHS